MNPNKDKGARKPGGQRFSPEQWERSFWSKVDKTGPCWLWTGCIGSNGYGYITKPPHMFGGGRGTVTAHRASLAIAGQIPPDGSFVCHHCDVRACVNPAHLYIGDAESNSKDAWDRGRIPQICGIDAPNARLTATQVAEIRDRYRPGSRAIDGNGSSAVELGREFGITAQYVNQLANGRWRANA